MREKLNISDIARLSGVASSTVSKVLNDYNGVSEEVKKKVLKIVKTHKYVPNLAARTLAGKTNKLIGLFIFDESNLSKSPYFETFATLAIDEIESKSYSTLISIVNSKSKKQKMLEFFRNGTIDAGIIIGATNNEVEIDELISMNYKVALIDQKSYSDSENTLILNSNNVEGGYLATKYLINKGCKNLLHITGSFNKLPTLERMEGFKKAVSEKTGITSYIFTGDYKISNIEDSLKLFLESSRKMIDGIFAASDEIAITAIKILKKTGIKIPDEISVVGYDNLEISEKFEQPLTTIAVDMNKTAHITVAKLIDIIEGRKVLENNFQSDLKLLIRET